MKNIPPVIKWSGSKRPLADEILSYFPKKIKTYYEPFCGGCSVLAKLLVSDIKVDDFVISDINEDLISLWKQIQIDPSPISSHYSILWEELNKDNDLERKKEFYAYIRSRFNSEKSPLDFMFIMRTTTNGMPRYNKAGNFNNSFHITRDGITPDKLDKILNTWYKMLNERSVLFDCHSYEEVETLDEEDVIFADPPYAGTNGMYFGGIDIQKMLLWLRKQEGWWAMTFDGKTSVGDMTFEIPKNIYSQHIYLSGKNSSFRRTIGKSSDTLVWESLYIK